MANGAGGRPSKLTQDVLDKTLAYFERKKSRKEAPYVEELAVYELDVSTETIRNWCKKVENKDDYKRLRPAQKKLHSEFFGTIKKLSDMQLFHYKVRGLKDGRNSVAIFLMKANHGMIETNKTQLSGPNDGPIEYKPIEVADV